MKFEQGLRETIAWYQKNTAWVEDLWEKAKLANPHIKVSGEKRSKGPGRPRKSTRKRGKGSVKKYVRKKKRGRPKKSTKGGSASGRKK